MARNRELERRSHELFPDNDERRKAWLRAVIKLRQSPKGWALDQKVERNPKPHVLQNYRAPTEQIRAVVSPPEEQVLPLDNVAAGPWKKVK